MSNRGLRLSFFFMCMKNTFKIAVYDKESKTEILYSNMREAGKATGYTVYTLRDYKQRYNKLVINDRFVIVFLDYISVMQLPASSLEHLEGCKIKKQKKAAHKGLNK